jgi:hypothetical protein
LDHSIRNETEVFFPFKNVNFSPEDIRITLVVAKRAGVASTKC